VSIHADALLRLNHVVVGTFNEQGRILELGPLDENTKRKHSEFAGVRRKIIQLPAT